MKLKQLIVTLLLTLITSNCFAFDLWQGGGFGFGGSIAGLPGASAQTAFLGFDSTLGTATFVRNGGAVNPDTGLWANENQILNSAVFVTQNVTTVATAYTLSMKGTGVITIGGTGSGVLTGTGANDRVSITFTPTAGTCSFTLSGGAGTVTEAQLQRGSVVGSYLETTGAAKYDQPRYVTGRDSVAGHGLLVEESSTNLYLNSATLSTQNVTTSATTYTASFWGTGTITFSGTYSGSLVGTGAADRVQKTFTATAGTLTSTVTGTVTNAQIGALPYATSYIPTTTAAATRVAEYATQATSGLITQDAAGTIQGWWKPEGVSAGKVQTIWSTYTGAADYTAIKYNGVILYAEKAKTGQVTEYVTIPLTATAGTWYHAALTINADGTMQLYHNGVGASAGLGSELIVDGTFTVGTGWSGTGWSVGSGVATGTATDSTVANSGSTAPPLHKVLKYSFDIKTRTGGTLSARLGGDKSGVAYSSTGIKTDALIVGAGAVSIGVLGQGFTGTVDDFSVKEIYNSTSTDFKPVIATNMQYGAFNGTLQINGALDNFRFFNRVLTANEILTYVNKGK